MSIEIVYANEKYFKSFHETLGAVAQEKIYIEMIEAPDFEKLTKFFTDSISKNYPAYYAIDNEKVIGWCDATPFANPRMSHRASIGMGLLPEYRGKGLGTKLLNEVIEHSKKIGIEKLELSVYTTNIAAISLYKKLGFTEEGVSKKFRKLNGEYFDCLNMSKFL